MESLIAPGTKKAGHVNLSQRLETPREMKRFINRVRYAATRVGVEVRRATIVARIGASFHALRALGIPRAAAGNEPSLDEGALVRLAAYDVCVGNVDTLASDWSQEQKMRDADPVLADCFYGRTPEQRGQAVLTFRALFGSVQY